MAFRACFLGRRRWIGSFCFPSRGRRLPSRWATSFYGQNLVKVLTMDAKPGKNAQLYPNDAQIRAWATKVKRKSQDKAAANDHKRTFFSCFFCAWIECAKENFTKTQKTSRKRKKREPSLWISTIPLKNLENFWETLAKLFEICYQYIITT